MSTVRDRNFMAIQIYLAAKMGTESFRLSFQDGSPGRWHVTLETHRGALAGQTVDLPEVS